ncbi:hypothetical protein [Methylobacterium sp. WL120]|uniref:hypothetical protein n=1 Tax=Methylobacterium sp. WL120 TaxID=2603887 RepID=UPI0011CBA11B|nr:hypothetical protein [Methylobacterium sp. WL120]TXM63637.1 hypothetical protein FV229_21730 [Methylobacterium sp. WL120]
MDATSQSPEARDPACRRAALDAIGEGVGRVLPPPDDGLGESLIRRAYSGRAASEAEEDRLVVRFGTEWRTFIRRQTPDRLTALDELIDERIERRALARFYRRMKHAAVVVVVTAFALAQFGVDRLPLVRQLWRLVRGDLR